MPRRDIYHEAVKRALQKDGWIITHDPFPLEIGRKRLSADLGAERPIVAEKGMDQIVVEIKSFVGVSDVRDLEQALGQYVLYQQILNEMGVDRPLYLAIPGPAYKNVFTIEIGEMLIANQILRLIVFDATQEVILKWVPS